MPHASRKSSRPKKRAGRSAAVEGKVRKEFWLDPATLGKTENAANGKRNRYAGDGQFIRRRRPKIQASPRGPPTAVA